MASGEALKPGFDDIINGQIVKGISTGLGYACLDDVCNVMEANIVTATDDWEMKDSYLDDLMKDQADVDVYFIFTAFDADRMWRGFGRKCKKPVIIVPNL